MTDREPRQKIIKGSELGSCKRVFDRWWNDRSKQHYWINPELEIRCRDDREQPLKTDLKPQDTLYLFGEKFC